ncbi:hypothetical protein BpHYR1_007660 [Brachionus plicatilis]|uniref:Uncharacterized protein n=1 Tax=Brachionus plicatilis TaxID=10195 RepID=A0A3M7T9X1_BRAPC|nr:hypothetical protein BpHYR1_007660 [Brachionus plicatilis]
MSLPSIHSQKIFVDSYITIFWKQIDLKKKTEENAAWVIAINHNIGLKYFIYINIFFKIQNQCLKVIKKLQFPVSIPTTLLQFKANLKKRFAKLICTLHQLYSFSIYLYQNTRDLKQDFKILIIYKFYTDIEILVLKDSLF